MGENRKADQNNRRFGRYFAINHQRSELKQRKERRLVLPVIPQKLDFTRSRTLYYGLQGSDSTTGEGTIKGRKTGEDKKVENICLRDQYDRYNTMYRCNR